MGGCPCKTLTINKGRGASLKCIEPFIFSVSDAESVLMEAQLGDYLLYRDYTTDRILLSVRYNSHIRHHRISQDQDLYYLNGQPYPYLDSIVRYHQQHRLDSLKLQKQAQLSARVVRLFAHKVSTTNGNNVYTMNHEDTNNTIQQQQQLQQHQQFHLHDNNNVNHHHNYNHHNNHHPYLYENASFVADEEGIELEEKTIQNGGIPSPDDPSTTLDSVHHHSNGTAAMIPSTNQHTPSKMTSTAADGGNEPKPRENEPRPGNTTPTENAIESPQPEPVPSANSPDKRNPFLDTSRQTTTTISPSRLMAAISSSPDDLPPTLTANGTRLSKNYSSFSGSPYLLNSPRSSKQRLVDVNSPSKITKSARRTQSFLSTSSSPFSRKSSIAQDTDHNTISLSSWAQINPTPRSALSDFNNSTVSSHASLISISSEQSKIIYSEHL